jgi:NADPH-dependent 2,4-dienoyl-CoA reductase/sulfur reductase-like enzyme
LTEKFFDGISEEHYIYALLNKREIGRAKYLAIKDNTVELMFLWFQERAYIEAGGRKYPYSISPMSFEFRIEDKLMDLIGPVYITKNKKRIITIEDILEQTKVDPPERIVFGILKSIEEKYYKDTNGFNTSDSNWANGLNLL